MAARRAPLRPRRGRHVDVRRDALGPRRDRARAGAPARPAAADRGMTVGYLGLGSNVGARRAHLQAAVALLPAHGARGVASSPVYETEPVGEVLEQREFLNAVVRVETA